MHSSLHGICNGHHIIFIYHLHVVRARPVWWLLQMPFYGSQTKILERWTKDEMMIFEALFNGSWPKLSTHALEKCFENPHFIFCSSFQNLRLVSIHLERICCIDCHYLRFHTLLTRGMKVRSFSRHVYAPQTMILEGWTKDEMRILQERFKSVMTTKRDGNFMRPKRRFGRRNKWWNPAVRTTFQGREYSIWASSCWKPNYANEDFGRPNKPFRMRFPGKHFSTIRSPNRVLTPFESASRGIAFGTVCSAFQNLRLGRVQMQIDFMMLSSSCDFDMHIGILSQCDVDQRTPL
jgi:hypothetical protein